jgi:hypothetical protein
VEEKVVSSVPAAGLKAYYRNQDGSFFGTEIIAWAITDKGRVIPITSPHDHPDDDMSILSLDIRAVSNFVTMDNGKNYTVDTSQTRLRRRLNQAWKEKQVLA